MEQPRTQQEMDEEIPSDDPAGSSNTENATEPPATYNAPDSEAPKAIGDHVTAPTAIKPIC